MWPHFWAIQIILFLLILVYCTAPELARVFERERCCGYSLGQVTPVLLSENYGFVPCWTFIHVSGLSHRDGTKVPLLNCLAFLKLCGVGIDL